MNKIVLFVFISLLFCPSCIHHQMEMGKKIDPGKIEQIIISSLTDEELVKLSEQAIKTLKEKDLAKEKKDSPDA